MSGSLNVVIGGMWAGKSTSLLREYQRGIKAKKNVVVLKPQVDTRYSENYVVSHDKAEVQALVIPTGYTFCYSDLVEKADIVLIDEIQFFDKNVLSQIEYLRERRKDIYVYGLDMDFMGNPFENVSYLVARANKLEKINAICNNCGKDAWISKKISGSTTIIDVGADDKYEPLCYYCYKKGD